MSLRARSAMAALAVVLTFILLLPGVASAQQAPLFGPAPASSDATDGSSDAGPATSADQGGLLHRLEGFIIVTQRNVNREINRRLIAVRDGHGPGVVFAGLLIAFLYGVFHALGPGHGKTVIVGYFLGRGGSIARGTAMAGWIALSHVLGAITIVGVLHYVLARSLATPVEETLWLRQVSYGAILVIGLAMVTMALRDRRAIALAGSGTRGQLHEPGPKAHCGHAHSVRGLREQRLLAVAAGFIPCTGAILILVFAFTNGILLIGIVMAFFIAIGMGLTLAALGIAGVLAHHHVRARIAGGRGMETFLSLLGPLLITAIGLVLLSGALIQGNPS